MFFEEYIFLNIIQYFFKTLLKNNLLRCRNFILILDIILERKRKNTTFCNFLLKNMEKTTYN